MQGVGKYAISIIPLGKKLKTTGYESVAEGKRRSAGVTNCGDGHTDTLCENRGKGRNNAILVLPSSTNLMLREDDLFPANRVSQSRICTAFHSFHDIFIFFLLILAVC